MMNHPLETEIRRHRELLPPPAARLVASTLWFTLKSTLHPDINPEDYEHLAELNDILAQKSAIGYAYHPQEIEAVTLPLVLKDRLPNLLHAFGPMAAYMYHKPASRLWAIAAAALLNSHYLPVVREDNPKDAPFVSHTDAYRTDLFQLTRQLLPEPGSLYGVVLGGKRDKVLPPFETLNTSAAKLAIKYRLPVVPMAAYSHQGQFSLHIGEPFLLQPNSPVADSEAAAVAYSIVMMRRLATLLPPELRGAYDTSLLNSQS